MLRTATDSFCKVFPDKHACVHVCMHDPIWEDHLGASTLKAGLFYFSKFLRLCDVTEQNTVV